MEIVGACRIAEGARLLDERGVAGLIRLGLARLKPAKRARDIGDPVAAASA